MAWGDYLAELRRRGIKEFPVIEEMGDYPMLPTRDDWADHKIGLEIVFLKPAGKYSFPFTCHSFTGDTQSVSIRARLADGSVGPVLLSTRNPSFAAGESGS